MCYVCARDEVNFFLIIRSYEDHEFYNILLGMEAAEKISYLCKKVREHMTIVRELRMKRARVGLAFLIIFESLFFFFFNRIVSLISMKCEDLKPQELFSLVWVLQKFSSGQKGD